MAKMTAREIESKKRKSAPYKLAIDTGLQLRVATDSAKPWLVRYMIGGEEGQYRLPRPYHYRGGEGFASLADATAVAAKICALARQGIDYQIQLDESNKAERLRRERERAEAWLPETGRKDTARTEARFCIVSKPGTCLPRSDCFMRGLA